MPIEELLAQFVGRTRQEAGEPDEVMPGLDRRPAPPDEAAPPLFPRR